MDPMTVGLIGLAVLVVVLFSRMPVGFVMALLGVVGFSYVVTWEGGLRMLAASIVPWFVPAPIML